jgi:hypothetical protein
MAVWHSFINIWYIFLVLVRLDQDKSGNPVVSEKAEKNKSDGIARALLGRGDLQKAIQRDNAFSPPPREKPDNLLL